MRPWPGGCIAVVTFLATEASSCEKMKCICFHQLIWVERPGVYTVCIYDTVYDFIHIDVDTDIFFSRSLLEGGMIFIKVIRSVCVRV